MQRGFALPISGSWATPDNVIRVAQRAEALGYQSLWTFQRLLCPLDEHGQPELDPQYRSVHDPLALLAFAAGQTRTARLGVAVVNAPYYAPILLAKMLNTIDVLSGGRLDVGLGLGWNPQEFEAVGVSTDRRGARTEDFVACLQAIWTDDVVDYTGPFYRVPRSRIAPPPVQRPHPPLYFGGTAEPALRRAGRLGTGWISSSRVDASTIRDAVGVVRAGAAEASKDPDAVRIVCRAVVKVRDGERGFLTGSFADIEADLTELASWGVTDAFVDVNFDPQIGSPDADPDESLRRAETVLERLAPR
jgi:probable F420-dependent oxidoreductase